MHKWHHFNIKTHTQTHKPLRSAGGGAFCFAFMVQIEVNGRFQHWVKAVCSILQTTDYIKECEWTSLNFILDTYFQSSTLVTHILDLTFALHIIINLMAGMINFSEQKRQFLCSGY